MVVVGVATAGLLLFGLNYSLLLAVLVGFSVLILYRRAVVTIPVVGDRAVSDLARGRNSGAVLPFI